MLASMRTSFSWLIWRAASGAPNCFLSCKYLPFSLLNNQSYFLTTQFLRTLSHKSMGCIEDMMTLSSYKNWISILFQIRICVCFTELQRKSDQEELLWRKSLTPTNWVMNKSTETNKRPLPVAHIINTHGDPNRLPCHHDTWHCQHLPRNNRSIDQNLLTGQHGKVSGQIQSSDSEEASYPRKTSRYVWKSTKFWNHQVVVFWITWICISSTKAKQSLSGISYGSIQVYGLGLCVIWLMPWDDTKVRQS